jgi:hypothetical protein
MADRNRDSLYISLTIKVGWCCEIAALCYFCNHLNLSLQATEGSRSIRGGLCLSRERCTRVGLKAKSFGGNEI